MLLVILVGALLTPIQASATTDDITCASAEGKFSDSTEGRDGLRYSLQVVPDEDRVAVEIHNPTNVSKEALAKVSVDGKHVQYRFEPTLKSNECWKKKFDLTHNISILKDNHWVSMSSWGDYINISFEKEIDERNTTEYPRPQIVGVEIINATTMTNTGVKNHSQLNITIRNPSRQVYGPYILVNTNESNGHWIPGTVYYGMIQFTHTYPLYESQGEQVQGEIRLVLGGPGYVDENRSIRDQVWFSGRAGGEVVMRNESFEPVVPPGKENSYTYGVEPEDDPLLGIDRSNWTHSTAIVAGAVLGTIALLTVVYRFK